MKEIKQVTKIFLDRFETLGQNGFFASQEELLVLGIYLKKVGRDMGIDDNYKLLELFSGIYVYWKGGKEFIEFAENEQRELDKVLEKYKNQIEKSNKKNI